jgi:hypothetical protein
MPTAGFTLIEVLIAAILTLLMMAALAKGFKIFTDGITEGRSRIAVVEKLRNVVALIRHDLESCTVRPAPPLEVFNGTGYFELYDGPFTDYTSSYFGFDRNALGTEMLAESRFGDPDDILMFTARSKGTPFTGKVPMALLKAAEKYRVLVAQGIPVTNINQISLGINTEDWETTTVIASEYAEIVYFLLPVPNAFTQDAQIVYDPTTGLPSFATTPSGFPKEYQLHRRVLLIRPDLNIVVNNLAPYLYSNGVSSSQVVAAPSNPADDRLMLAQAHQNCDLSIRRLRGNSMLVAANSLEDLKQRENRFAHWVRRAGGSNTTMPILALTDSIYNTRSDSPASPFSIGDPTAGTPPLGRTIAFASGTIPQYTGFMHPAFALGGDRLGGMF